MGTGKSLQQIFDKAEGAETNAANALANAASASARAEKRIPISALPFTITQPGSYYLTVNLTASAASDTIRVEASDVSIDLNGFTLDGAGFFGTAITASNSILHRTRIFNGNIVRFSYAIYFDAVTASEHSVERVSVDCVYGGFSLGGRSMVKNCRVLGGGGGISVGSDSEVADCVVHISAGNGVNIASGIVRGVVARNTSGVVAGSTGISASGRANIETCSVQGFATGVFTPDGAVRDCTVTAGNTGVLVYGSGSVSGCTVDSSEPTYGTLVGIRVVSGSVSGCVVQRFATGISCDGSGRIENCAVRDVGTCGISSAIGSSVTRCSVRDSGGFGISVGSSSTVSECIAHQNSTAGIRVSGSSIVRDNECTNNNIGVRCEGGGGNRIEGNSIASNTYGIRFFVGNNAAFKNTLYVNIVHVDGSAGNQVAPLENAGTSTNPWSNLQLF